MDSMKKTKMVGGIAITVVAQSIVTGVRLGAAYLYFTKFNKIPKIVKFAVLATTSYGLNSFCKKYNNKRDRRDTKEE